MALGSKTALSKGKIRREGTMYHKKILPLILFCAVLCLINTFAELPYTDSDISEGKQKEGIMFSIPLSWTNVVTDKKSGRCTFETSKDPSKKLIGYIRSFRVAQTAKEWCIDEARSIETKGIQIITQPEKIMIGDVIWFYLAWETPMPYQGKQVVFKGQQYYLNSNQKMVEVFVAAPKEVFNNAGTDEIKRFLATVSIK